MKARSSYILGGELQNVLIFVVVIECNITVLKTVFKSVVFNSRVRVLLKIAAGGSYHNTNETRYNTRVP